MTTIQYLYLYLLTVPVFAVIDLLWLGVIAKSFYQTHIGSLLGPVQWVPAIAFYLLYILGILVFAVVPALEVGSLIKAVLLGAFFGFVAYGTYDLTNHATLRDWPMVVTVVDMAWGAFFTGSVATLSYLIGKYLFF